MAASLIEYISCTDGKHFMRELEEHGRILSLDEIKEKDSSVHHLVVVSNKTLTKVIIRRLGIKSWQLLFFGKIDRS